MTVTILKGDCRDVLRTLPAESVHCVVTSPPYWGLRDYGSRFYHLGGWVETLAEVEARDDPKEETLRFNMRGNGYDRIVVNDNSWRSTRPFGETDVVLDWKPRPKPEAA
jgi:DNA modification methylase